MRKCKKHVYTQIGVRGFKHSVHTPILWCKNCGTIKDLLNYKIPKFLKPIKKTINNN